MTETQIWRPSPVRAPADVAPGAKGRESRGRRWRLRLWTILNAQALMDGAGDRDGIVRIEDDHQRLARRRN